MITNSPYPCCCPKCRNTSILHHEYTISSREVIGFNKDGALMLGVPSTDGSDIEDAYLICLDCNFKWGIPDRVEYA